MTREYADDVVAWQYPPPYDCYDMTDADPMALADPASGFYAVLDGQHLIAFRSFGVDRQVPGGSYDDLALDTGRRPPPGSCGHGLGSTVISTGLGFGRKACPATRRVTVATFNTRALRVVQRLDFTRKASFFATGDGRRYEILVRAESVGCAHSP